MAGTRWLLQTAAGIATDPILRYFIAALEASCLTVSHFSPCLPLGAGYGPGTAIERFRGCDGLRLEQ